MFHKKKEVAVERKQLPILETDPDTGLSESAVLQRQEFGWSNVITKSVTRTEKQIFAENILTFFNLILLYLRYY